MTLPELSAAATQGALIHHGWGDGSTLGGMTNIFNEDAEVLLMECIPEADAAFIVALWNAYRTGQLVERDAVAGVVAEKLRQGLDHHDRFGPLPDSATVYLTGNDEVFYELPYEGGRLTLGDLRAALTAINGGDDADG